MSALANPSVFYFPKTNDNQVIVLVNGASAVQKKAVTELRQEAAHLKEEFRDYLEDLELFTNPEFWEAVEEVQSGKLKKFPSVREMLAELDD